MNVKQGAEGKSMHNNLCVDLPPQFVELATSLLVYAIESWALPLAASFFDMHVSYPNQLC